MRSNVPRLPGGWADSCMTISKTDQAIAILRRCRCCDTYRSIDAFTELGKVCRECVAGDRATGRIARARAIVLIPTEREAAQTSA